MGSPAPSRARPVTLVMLDAARAPFFDRLAGQYPQTRVRLDDYLSIDAQALTRNPVVLAPFRKAKEMGGRVHLIGLVGDDGTQSSPSHLYALIDIAKQQRVRVVVHVILGANDVQARTAERDIEELDARLESSVGRIGTVCGRAWAMDAEDRWERVEKVYRAIMADNTKRADTAKAGIHDACMFGAPEAFVEPFVVFDYPGVSLVDTAFFFNFGTCRSRALTSVLADTRFSHFARTGGRAPFAGRLTCMTPYDSSVGLASAFPRAPDISDLPLMTLADAKLNQFRSVAGAASEIADAVEVAIRDGGYDFVLADFANPANPKRRGFSDTLDKEVAQLIAAARAVGGSALIVGGRAADNTVPVAYINDAEPNVRIREDAVVSELGATLLDLLQLPQSDEVEGRSLIAR